MSEILQSVNQRTQLVSENRLELLLFKLNSRQRFGINVFSDVLRCPKLTLLPKLNNAVRDIAHIREQTISIINMSFATGAKRIENLSTSYIIIAEYNSLVLGFLVISVERIINVNWQSIMPPPGASRGESDVTAVTQIEEGLIDILDVEKILDDISPANTDLSDDVADKIQIDNSHEKIIFIADDSCIAQIQIKKALSSLGLKIESAKNGFEALEKLKTIDSATRDITDKVDILISDIKMPDMDGYTLTVESKNTPELKICLLFCILPLAVCLIKPWFKTWAQMYLSLNLTLMSWPSQYKSGLEITNNCSEIC
jgi:two-component system chemotaxis response regulator CheV